jgi:hypothetical protein
LGALLFFAEYLPNNPPTISPLKEFESFRRARDNKEIIEI